MSKLKDINYFFILSTYLQYIRKVLLKVEKIFKDAKINLTWPPERAVLLRAPETSLDNYGRKIKYIKLTWLLFWVPKHGKV